MGKYTRDKRANQIANQDNTIQNTQGNKKKLRIFSIKLQLQDIKYVLLWEIKCAKSAWCNVNDRNKMVLNIVQKLLWSIKEHTSRDDIFRRTHCFFHPSLVLSYLMEWNLEEFVNNPKLLMGLEKGLFSGRASKIMLLRRRVVFLPNLLNAISRCLLHFCWADGLYSITPFNQSQYILC